MGSRWSYNGLADDALRRGVNIAPDAITDDTGYLYTTQKGARLRLRKVSATEWFGTAV